MAAANPSSNVDSSEQLSDCEIMDTPQTDAPPSKRRSSASASNPKRRKSVRISKGSGSADDSADHSDGEGSEVADMTGRTMIPILSLDKEFLINHQLVEVVEAFSSQGWNFLFGCRPSVDEALLREFYSTYSLLEKSGTLIGYFTVKGNEMVFTSKQLAGWLEIPHDGFAEYAKGRWPSTLAEAPKEVAMRISGDPDTFNTSGDTALMGIVHRTLHRVVCRNLTPRQGKQNVIQILDYLMVDKLLKREAINLPKLIMVHMEHIKTIGRHSLPYPGIVKLIMEKCCVYNPEKETAAWESLGVDNFSAMGWTFSEGQGWSRTATRSPAPKRTRPPAASVPSKGMSVDLTPVLEALGRMEEDMSAMTGRVTAMEERMGRMEESIELILRNNVRHTESISSLNEQLRYVGTTLVDELKELFRSGF